MYVQGIRISNEQEGEGDDHLENVENVGVEGVMEMEPVEVLYCEESAEMQQSTKDGEDKEGLEDAHDGEDA